MKESQIRGYYFEKIIQKLMEKTNYIDINRGEVPGRGANHEIDSYGTFSINTPFIYPIRLISEAKWHYRNIGLPKIRDFFGVIKDISEYYHVPLNQRGKIGEDIRFIDRYTDCGAFFSVSSFSKEAQEYAWAHGIYLISFENNRILKPLLDRSLELIERDLYNRTNITKQEIQDKADNHFRVDERLSSELNKIFSYLGILDSIYPILIISSKEFNFEKDAPDDLEVTNEGIIENTAFKENRTEEENIVNFKFKFKNIPFEFTIPRSTSGRIIHAINNTYKGDAFSYIDIPIKLSTERGSYRRTFRMKLALPREEISKLEIKNNK